MGGITLGLLVVTGVLRAHGVELPSGDALGGGSHGRGLSIVQDGDARGGKALHGAHAHAYGHDGVDADFGEDTHGRMQPPSS